MTFITRRPIGRHWPLSGALSLFLLAACGGGGGAAPAPDAPASAPTSAPADVVAPIVAAAGVTVNQDTAIFSVTAADNVGVAEVEFIVDEGAMGGRVSERPTDGVYTLSLPVNLIAPGAHRAVARVSDAAGNSTDSDSVVFNVARPGDEPAPQLPTVTASVAGNFGLVALSAVTNATNLRNIEFVVDGQSVGFFLSSDGEARFLVLDATGLADGRHSVVARAHVGPGLDHIDSQPVALDLDAAAGTGETEPNDTRESANAVEAGERQVIGFAEAELLDIGDSSVVLPAVDYYKVSLPPGTSLRVDMRSNGHPFFSMSLEDAAGRTLAADNGGAVGKTITYTSGSNAEEVYIRVLFAAVRLDDSRRRYLLLLNRP